MELKEEVLLHFADARPGGWPWLERGGVAWSDGLGARRIDGIHEVLGAESRVVVIDGNAVCWCMGWWLMVRWWTHGSQEHVVLARPAAQESLAWPQKRPDVDSVLLLPALEHIHNVLLVLFRFVCSLAASLGCWFGLHLELWASRPRGARDIRITLEAPRLLLLQSLAHCWTRLLNSCSCIVISCIQRRRFASGSLNHRGAPFWIFANCCWLSLQTLVYA